MELGQIYKRGANNIMPPKPIKSCMSWITWINVIITNFYDKFKSLWNQKLELKDIDFCSVCTPNTKINWRKVEFISFFWDCVKILKHWEDRSPLFWCINYLLWAEFFTWLYIQEEKQMANFRDKNNDKPPSGEVSAFLAKKISEKEEKGLYSKIK